MDFQTLSLSQNFIRDSIISASNSVSGWGRPIDCSQLPSVPGDQCEGARNDEARQHEERGASQGVCGCCCRGKQPSGGGSENPQCDPIKSGTVWKSTRWSLTASKSDCECRRH